MVLASFAIAMFNFPFAVSALAWGSIIVSLSLYYGHRMSERSAALRRAELAAESQQVIAESRLRLVEAILPHLPKETSTEDFVRLLGSTSAEEGDVTTEADNQPSTNRGTATSGK